MFDASQHLIGRVHDVLGSDEVPFFIFFYLCVVYAMFITQEHTYEHTHIVYKNTHMNTLIKNTPILCVWT